MKLTLLVSSQLCGLLHDVLQWVSVHPHPHWLLRDALTLLLCVLAGGMVPHHTCCSNSSDCTPFLLLMCRYTIPWHQGYTVFLWHETNSVLCLYHFWPFTRRFSVRECSPPSPMKFVTGCSAYVISAAVAGGLVHLYEDTHSNIEDEDTHSSMTYLTCCHCQ